MASEKTKIVAKKTERRSILHVNEKKLTWTDEDTNVFTGVLFDPQYREKHNINFTVIFWFKHMSDRVFSSHILYCQANSLLLALYMSSAVSIAMFDRRLVFDALVTLNN